MRRRRFTLVSCLFLGLFSASGAGFSQNKPAPANPEQSAFTDRIASQLLDQIAAGLVAHNQKKMLSAFDLAKMADGQLFKQQITSFFSQTGSIRVHFNLLQVSMEGTQGIVTVNVELEAGPLESNDLPLRKNAQLRLVAENSGGGWKLTGVQPRAFFSTIQP
jgi:hypothetical protein